MTTTISLCISMPEVQETDEPLSNSTGASSCLSKLIRSISTSSSPSYTCLSDLTSSSSAEEWPSSSSIILVTPVISASSSSSDSVESSSLGLLELLSTGSSKVTRRDKTGGENSMSWRSGSLASGALTDWMERVAERGVKLAEEGKGAFERESRAVGGSVKTGKKTSALHYRGERCTEAELTRVFCWDVRLTMSLPKLVCL